jgi:hypothetical protein
VLLSLGCLASGLARYANLRTYRYGTRVSCNVNYMIDGNLLLPLTDLEKRVCEVAVCDRCFDDFLKKIIQKHLCIMGSSTRLTG